jgi:hypothetical protein
MVPASQPVASDEYLLPLQRRAAPELIGAPVSRPMTAAEPASIPGPAGRDRLW